MSKGQKIPNHIIIYIATFLISFISILAAFSAGWGFLISPNKIIKGISVKGTDVGQLNRQHAGEKLIDLQTKIDQETINFKYLEQERKTKLKELAVKIDLSKTIDKAMIFGHRGDFWTKWLVCKNAATRGYTIEPLVNINEEKVRPIVAGLTAGVERKSQDAGIKINDHDQVEIIPEIIGLQVDYNDALKQVTNIIKTKSPGQVNLKLIYTKPNIIFKDVADMGINSILSTFTTYFNVNEDNRVRNIRLAARTFDNLLVKPGAIVSFNQIVGPRNSYLGYKAAPVIVNDKITYGIGGGVCQVSTTLYNSVLLANLGIVERVKHSLPVNYVPPGMDATVDYDTIDFKFKNTTSYYLLIKSLVQGSSVTVKIYGHKSINI